MLSNGEPSFGLRSEITHVGWIFDDGELDDWLIGVFLVLWGVRAVVHQRLFQEIDPYLHWCLCDFGVRFSYFHVLPVLFFLVLEND